jgi:hypothetical protein
MTDTVKTPAQQPVRDSKGRFIKAAAIAEAPVTNPEPIEVLIVEEIEPVASKRGRKPIGEKRELMLEVLAEIRDGLVGLENPSPRATYFLQRKLADAGLVAFMEIKGEGRGRPRKIPTLTAEGLAQLEGM